MRVEPGSGAARAGLRQGSAQRDINGQTVTNSVTRLGFGYMIWQREGDNWFGSLFDVNAKPLDHCRLVARSLGCGQ